MKFEFVSNEESLKLNGKTIPRIWMIDYDSSRKIISIINIYYSPNHLEVLTDILFTRTNREFSNEFN